MLVAKHKTPLKSRTTSPSQNILSPNNDDFEKAQVRAARAAAQRRKSFVGLGTEKSKGQTVEEENLLGKEQILDLLQNCVKLAAENKINQRNTWELRLIDHISDIVNADDGEDTETNFQKASCTLEAGVKIYSYRVDSAHSVLYKVLGGLNRTAAYDDDDPKNDTSEAADASDENNDDAKKDSQKKMSSCEATLESYDALNVKDFDVAITVDPLFNQMSAQFDEGGAKGLLLNSLSLYNGCKLVFDSTEVPTRNVKLNPAPNSFSTMDLSPIKDCLQKFKLRMKTETEISPTLREILTMFDDQYRAAAQLEESRIRAEPNIEDEYADNRRYSYEDDGMGEIVDGPEVDQYDVAHTAVSVDEISHDNANWDFDFVEHDDGEAFNEDNGVSFRESNSGDNESRELVDWISAAVDLRSNAWAGPDHWKFRRSQDVVKNVEQPKPADKKKQRNDKFSIDFLCPPKVDMSAFTPVSDPKSLMMPQSNAPSSVLLPDDCHYQPENLVRLFLQPSIMCINHRNKQNSGMKRTYAEPPEMQWDDGDYGDVDDLNDNTNGDVEYMGENEMIPQPRKVQKIEVDYDKTSKQVDVRALKETLWQNLQEETSDSFQGSEETNISFKSVLNHVSVARVASSTPDDTISVHLCFICLLHLANEHNLRIVDCPSLDELYIQNVKSDVCASEITSC